MAEPLFGLENHRLSSKPLMLRSAQRDPGLSDMKGDPLLKKLERDPLYTPFLKKMRLPVN